MMIERLSDGTRTARKQHQCFHCYGTIWPGETYEFNTLKFDYVYTLCMHQDCQKLWDTYVADAALRYADYYDEGTPPLFDDWQESGGLEDLCNAYRGLFPNAVTRLELCRQRLDIRHDHWEMPQ